MRVLASVSTFLAAISIGSAADRWTLGRPIEHTGMCDASAAIAIDSNRFLVASDEDNTLRLYDALHNGLPLQSYDLSVFLGISGRNPEADLEGGARVGDRVYWIGSHSRSHDGEPRPNRQCFFAVDLQVDKGQVKFQPVGRPCHNLIDQLSRDVRYATFALAAASTKGPKEKMGLNIEGLCETKEASVVIGFRNPVPAGLALLASLLNPAEVTEGKPAVFGDPLLLDLDSLGFRDIAFYGGHYFIVAGPYDGGGPFRFYRWSGPGHEAKRMKVEGIGTYHPEVVILYPHTGTDAVQLLSDDGGQLINGRPCKELNGLGRFRSVWLSRSK